MAFRPGTDVSTEWLYLFDESNFAFLDQLELLVILGPDVAIIFLTKAGGQRVLRPW